MKKKTLRKCVACGERKEKHELVRIVRNKEEGILVDDTGRKNGRAAYLCRDLDCVEKAKKNKQLERALNTKIDQDIYEEIANELE